MATETWFEVRIFFHQENDGAAYLRKGPEAREAVLSLEEARRSFGKQRIIEALEAALAEVKKAD